MGGPRRAARRIPNNCKGLRCNDRVLVAGFEWGIGFYINPVSPEQAAQFLRDTEIDLSAGRKKG